MPKQPKRRKKWLLSLVRVWLLQMFRRNQVFRYRTHPFDILLRWSINFQEIQVQTRKICDHNWLHLVGHWNQQLYWFLKLTPPLHISLVTGRSLPVVGFKMCVASWSGWFRTALFRALRSSLTFSEECFGCPWLSKIWISRRKSQNQQKI